MADEFAEFGGAEVDEFAEFGGKMGDAVASPQATPGDWKSMWLTIGEKLFGGAIPGGMKEVAQDAASTLQIPVDAAQGFAKGLRREDFDNEAGLANEAGQVVGRYGPTAGAAIAAGAMMPAALPAVGLQAVANAVTAETIGGAAAGVGDLASMGISEAIGGNAPETFGDALKSAGTTGAETAMAGLGLGAVVGTIKTVAPRFLQSLQIVPAESLKHQIKTDARGMRGGNMTQKGAELRASVALRRIQNAAQAERNRVGQSVDIALETFEARVKGQKVINIQNAANRARAVVEDAGIGVGDDVIDAAAKASDLAHGHFGQSEIKTIMKIADEMDMAKAMTPKQAVNFRRRIDQLTSFRKGGAPEISSDIGQRAAHELGFALRESIEEAAKRTGNTQLLKANATANRFYKEYADIAREISTKKVTTDVMRDKIVQLAGRYNGGGVPQARITEKLPRVLPGAAKDVDELVDMITAREFILGVQKTPSGISMSALRSVLPGLGVIKLLPVAKQAEAVTRLLVRAGVPMAASKVNEPKSGQRGPR